MTKKNPTLKRARREAGNEAVVLYRDAAEEVRARSTADELVLEVWRRDEQLFLPGADGVVTKLAAMLGREVDGV